MFISNENFVIKDHTEWFPNTSFSPQTLTKENFLELGFYLTSSWKDHDPKLQKLVPTAPYLLGDIVYLVEAVDLSQEELTELLATQWTKVREQRNQLLLASDWTQLPDAPVSATAWAEYRQALRNVTQQTDPYNIAWPLQPGQEAVNA